MPQILEIVPGEWEIEWYGPANDINSAATGWQARRFGGWVPVSVDSYNPTTYVKVSDAIYVVVWKHVGLSLGEDPKWTATFGATEAQLKLFTSQREAQRYYPTMITASGAWPFEDASYERFGAVYEERLNGPTSLIRFAWNKAQLNTMNELMRKLHWRVRWAAIYGSSQPKYVVIYERFTRPFEVAWNLSTHDSWSDLDKHRVAHARLLTQPNIPHHLGGVRVAQVAMRDWDSTSQAPRYLALWHGDHVGPHALALITPAYDEPEKTLVQAAQAGFFPYRFSVGRAVTTHTDWHPYYAVILQKTDQVTARTLRVQRLAPLQHVPAPSSPDVAEVPQSIDVSITASSPGAVALAALEAYITSEMQRLNYRAGSLAVAVDKKLVYAAGYTWAEPGFPTTMPLSKFRMQSVSKILTSIGIFRRISGGMLTREDKVVEKGNLAPSSQNASNWNQLKLKHLFMHQVNWGIDAYHFDEKSAWEWLDAEVGTDAPVGPPLWSDKLARYLSRAGPFLTGYVVLDYNNTNYLLLGHILEQHTFQKYPTWIRGNVWANVGVPVSADPLRVWMSGLHPTTLEVNGLALPLEVPPDHPKPTVVPVRWDKTRLEELPFHVNPRTTGPYGGWLTAPLDVVRVLDALGGSDAYLSNKLMTRAARDEMWGFVASSKGSAPLTPTPVMNVVSPGGWSKTGPRLGHGGSGFGGVSTAVRFHDKKLSYCVAFNIWVPQNTIWNTATMLPLSLGRIEVLEDKIFDVQDAGGFSGPDLWPAAGITEPIG